jgi:RNA polymerase sigma-70 factor, ECF subfamily
MQEQDDAAQVMAAKADPRRFAVLYERYFGDIYRFLHRRAGHRELSADLTQQTFLKAMLALGRYEPRGLPFRAWLYRIAMNELRMYWRKRKEVVIDLGREEARHLGGAMGMPDDEGHLEKLARAMALLDERKAQLIELRYFDGLGFAELGQVLGIGEDAAKMRTHRALDHLRKAFKRIP